MLATCSATSSVAVVVDSAMVTPRVRCGGGIHAGIKPLRGKERQAPVVEDSRTLDFRLQLALRRGGVLGNVHEQRQEVPHGSEDDA